jgi:hypothetical protein
MRTTLAAALKLLLPTALLAAPAPVEPPEDASAFRRVLPEDTAGLAVLDVQQLLRSDLVKKELKGKLPAALTDSFLIPVRFKKLGIDLEKDLKQVVLATARSDWTDKEGNPIREGGVLILFRTTKTTASLADALKGYKGARDASEGALKLYAADRDGHKVFISALPGGILALSPARAPIVNALVRARAGKMPAWKNPEVAKFVKDLKPGVFLQGLALGEAVVSTSTEAVVNPGGGGREGKAVLYRLSESGLTALRFEAAVKEKITARVDLHFKDEAEAAKKSKEAAGIIVTGQLAIGGQLMMMPHLKPLAKILDSASAKQVDKAVRLEGEVEADAISALDNLAPIRVND